MSHMMVTEPGVEVELNTIASISICELRILAVGGGGYGSWGGGGSGFIRYFTKTLTSSPELIKMTVGEKEKASKVIITGKTIWAYKGDHGRDDVGGDGYCGGGGGTSDPCDGGTNGGNGHCSNGGNGTAEDISSYLFQNFKLTPGKGGLHYNTEGGYHLGGGGGGVLINDDGPGVNDNKAGVKWTHGEGYGGGGTYHADNYNDKFGKPGVIIIEVLEV